LRFAVELADEAGDEGKSGARLRTLLGDLLWKRGDHAEALAALQEAKRLAEQASDAKTLGDAFYYLGDLYYIEAFYMNKRDRAEPLEYHEKALALRRKADDRPGITHSLSRLGTMYEQTGEPERALALHDEAIRIATEIGYDRGLDRPITHRAAYHYRRGEFEAALAYFWQALDVIRRTGDQASLVFGLGSVGDTLCKIDEDHINVALQLCAHALAIAEELDFKLGICRTLLMTGGLYLGCGERDKAKEQFQRMAALAASVGYERFHEVAEEMKANAG
jgi:tetratricopeptide (TPR) repeat protein